MHSFKNDKVDLPMGAVWLIASISEYKGKAGVSIGVNVITNHET